jgi:hypothetical protein
VEHLLEIIDRAIELPAEVAGVDGFAVRVDGNLSGTVKDTLAAGHFVPLYEPQSVLPFPRVDDFAFQIFLPGQTVAAWFECSAISKADSPRCFAESQGIRHGKEGLRLSQGRSGSMNLSGPKCLLLKL